MKPHHDADTTEGDGGATVTPTGDLVVVSNRQPYSHNYGTDADGDRSVVVDRPAGGLTAGLDPVMRRTDGTWIAWGSGEADREVTGEDGTVRVPPEDPAYTLERVWLSEAAVEGYYYGYSNRALWPLCHDEREKARFDPADWRTYRRVNETFAAAAAERAGADSLVWFQDYHFGLAPRMVREWVPDAFLMQFWHIPWPTPGTLREAPRAQVTALLEGLLGNDLLGFHVDRYVENFLDCVETVLDATVDRGRARVRYDGHVTTVRAFPMGVDVAAVDRLARSADREFWERFRREHRIPAGAEVALGIDRLDYTKGIPERLAALERLWETRPEWRGEVSYVQKATESRSAIPEYQALQAEVRGAVERINDRFGTEDWQPVVYLEEMLPREELYALSRFSDLALVSPLADGMNLVSKEYVASQVDEDAVLVLSVAAGAHDALGDLAVSVDPTDTEAFAASIERALEMPQGERRHRMYRLRDRVESHDIYDWMTDVFTAARSLRGGETEAFPDVTAQRL